MEKNTETEIKLIIAKKDVKALVASPLVAKKTKKGSHKTVKLVNIYFDTRDLLLHQAGIAYRVRQNGKKYEATVKLGRAEAGGLSARQEYNVAVKNAKPNLSVFVESGLQVDFADILGTAQIEKLFTVRVKRELRLLQITKETVVVADLLAYTAKIAAEVPVFTESRSKYARGLALLDKLEPEGARPLPVIDWDNDYCEEYKKQFYQYGTAIMEEQNVFADCGKLQTEADRIFLPYFERMQAALYWLQPVMDGSAGMQANLQGALRPLYKLRDTKTLLRRWKSLFKLTDGRLGEDKVARLLENRLEDIGDEIQLQVMRGLEKIEDAMNREKEAETEKAEAILTGKLASAKKGRKVPLKEPGYATVTRLGKEFYYLTMANESSKLTDLSKESRKKLEKLGEAMRELFAVNSLGQSVPSELLKSNTVLSARQSGYLLGDLAAEQLMARKAVNKTFAKWLKTVKM